MQNAIRKRRRIIAGGRIDHGSFRIKRVYDAPPTRVFAAFADPAAKRRWFAEGEGWHVDEFNADFRACGVERSRFRYGEATRLLFTEYDAHLTGPDETGSREAGMRGLLETLARELAGEL